MYRRIEPFVYEGRGVRKMQRTSKVGERLGANSERRVQSNNLVRYHQWTKIGDKVLH